MVINEIEVTQLRNKLFESINTNRDTGEFTTKLISADIDIKTKEIIALMYSNLIAHREQTDRDRVNVLSQLLDYVYIMSKDISGKVDHLEANVESVEKTIIENTVDETPVYTPPPMQDIPVSPAYQYAPQDIPPPSNEPYKWYKDVKGIAIGGIVFLPMVGGLTAIFAYNPEAAEKAVETFLTIFVKVIIPGV